MPESRNRHKHHHPHHPAPLHSHPKRKRSAAAVLSILTAILGLAVAFFSQGADLLWLITGSASGAVVGYFIGHNMDKTIEKNK